MIFIVVFNDILDSMIEKRGCSGTSFYWHCQPFPCLSTHSGHCQPTHSSSLLLQWNFSHLLNQSFNLSYVLSLKHEESDHLFFFPLIFNLLVLYYLVACDCKTKPGQKKSDKTTEWVKITSFLLNYGNQSSQNKLCLQAMKEWGIGQNHFAVQWFQRIHCTPWTLVRICLLMDPQTKIHTQRERVRETVISISKNSKRVKNFEVEKNNDETRTSWKVSQKHQLRLMSLLCFGCLSALTKPN